MIERDRSSRVAAGVSRGSIVAAALAVVAEEGTEGLTMRTLADRLQVRASSLYNHIRNKEQLLELVADEAFGAESLIDLRVAFERVGTVQEWIRATRRGCTQLHDFYTAHPGLAAQVQRRMTPHRDRGPSPRAALVRAEIQALVRLGVPEDAARALFEAVSFWMMAAVVADTHTATTTSPSRRYQDGLELFMTGIEQHLQSLTPPGPGRPRA